MLRILFERAPVGVAYLDGELRYVAVNDVMAAMNGLPAADHVGRTPREVVPDVSSRLERLVAERVIRRGESVLDVTLVGETPAAPGRRREWRVSVHPVGSTGVPHPDVPLVDGLEAGHEAGVDPGRSGGGSFDPSGRRGGVPPPSVTGICILAVEVSAEREAEAQRRSLQAVLAGERARLDAVIQQLSVGIAVVDVGSGRVLVRNAAAARITGLRRGPVSETLARLPTFRPDGTPIPWEERPLVQALRRGTSVLDQPLVIERADGERLRLRVSATPLHAGPAEAEDGGDGGGSAAGPAGEVADGVLDGEAGRSADSGVVVVTFEDVTERRRNQLALELLARLGDVLSGLDELPEALGAAARACVGELADACTVHVRDASGAVQRVAAAPGAVPPALEIAVEVIDHGETHYAPHEIVTPIPGPAGPVGSLGLAMVRPNRRFAPADVDVAKRLAERFAAGIAQRRAHERTRRLQVLATALAEAASPAEIRTTARRVGAEVTGASAAALLRVDGAGTAHPLGEEGVGRLRSDELAALVGPTPGDGSSRPARRLGPHDPFPPRFGTGQARIGPLEAATWAVLPLQVGAAPRLLLAFGFESDRAFPAEERALLAAVAEQVEVALERAERFEAERGGRRRAERIQALAEELAVAERPEQVLSVLIGPARVLLGASAGLVVVTDPADPERLRAWRAPTAPPDAGPAAGAASDGEGSLPQPVEESALPPATLAALQAGLPSVTSGAADWPLSSGGRISGALHFDFVPPLGQREVGEMAVTLAALAALSGQALGRTGRSAFEHEVAVTLQRAMLPLQIDAPDLDVAAAYQPASERLEVGGDWYDVLPLDDGRLALVVGDVVGRGLPAATAMGRLRHATRALRFVRGPAELLSLLDPVAAEDASTRFATVVCVIVDLDRGRATYATAGHPPPLLRAPDGPVILLEDANSVPLGLRRGVARPEADVELPVGATLLLYTDGLVERRGESIDAGLARLCDVLAGQDGVASRQVVDRAVDRLLHGRDHHDDVAILCAQRLPPGSLRHRFPGHPADLVDARHALATWLVGRLSPTDAADLVLAAGEALANAVEHVRDEDGRSVELTAWADDDGIAVRVRDRGAWQPGRSATPFGGRGLGIMEVLTDEVTIERGAPPTVSGTTVVLRRRPR